MEVPALESAVIIEQQAGPDQVLVGPRAAQSSEQQEPVAPAFKHGRDEQIQRLSVLACLPAVANGLQHSVSQATAILRQENTRTGCRSACRSANLPPSY